MFRKWDFFSPNEETKIPQGPGIYAFFLRPFRASSFGVYDDYTMSEDELNWAAKKLKQKALSLERLFMSIEAEGDIRQALKVSHVAKSYRIRINETSAISDSRINFINTKNVAEILRFLDGSWHILPPVYIGITHNQTLRNRFLQHRLNFYNKTQQGNLFGTRLAKSGFSWDDLVFGCQEQSPSDSIARDLHDLEDLLQLLTKPILSVR